MNHDTNHAHRVTLSIPGWGEATYNPHDPATVSSLRQLIDAHLERKATERHVYVVAQHRDDKPARVECYSSFDVAQARQRELGVGSTTLASRRIDDPLLMKRCQSKAGESPSQPASEVDAPRTYDDGVQAGRLAVFEELGSALSVALGTNLAAPLRNVADVIAAVRRTFSAEYQAGRDAFARGEKDDACPFPVASEPGRAWRNGWLQALGEVIEAKIKAKPQCAVAERRFTSWPMSSEEQRVAEAVRRGARELAETIASHVPQGPERDRAIDALEQASMLAVAGIARPPVGPTTKSEA